MTLVSIVIPIYNVEAYLPRCLESVVNQTYRDLEIICVNDGSPDHCDKILEDYAKRDSRVRIVNRKNGGLSAARNSGAAVATGKYIYFLDSDDWLSLDAMERCVTLAEEKQLDEIVFECVPELESPDLGKNFGIYKNDFICDEVLPGGKIYARSVRNYSYLPCAWLRFVNRSFYVSKGLGFYEGIIHEDELFSVQCDLQAERAFFMKGPVYHHSIRRNSIITKGMSFINIRALGTVYLETLAFLVKHPEIDSDVLDAVHTVQDWWLGRSGDILRELSESEIQQGIQQEPRLAVFMDYVRLYSRYCQELHNLEVETAKREELLKSGSYKLGRFLGKILTPWRIFKGK